MNMLSREVRQKAKTIEVRRLLAEKYPPERASNIKIDVRDDKGGLCKVFLRCTLKKTRTTEGQSPTASSSASNEETVAR